ncbi:MAG: glycosyltransferase [Fibrobacter sp.]|nr:glycosyltransferase [Fibrobacter sp.]
MISQRWIVVIPPRGAAREVMLQTIAAISDLSNITIKEFDCLKYENAFNSILKHPEYNLVTDLLDQSLVISCLDFDATHCLIGALSPVTLFTLNLLRKKGIKTIHWFFEDYQRTTYWRDVISGYDYFCAIQQGPFTELCNENSSVFHFLPTAYGGKKLPVLPPEKSFDIAFIGLPSPYRISILERLCKEGFSLRIAGSGWNAYSGLLSDSIIETSWINHDQMMKLLTESKIGLNLSIENPANREDVHISPRVYDVLAAGCVLVTEEVLLLYRSLPLCHFYTFKEMAELVDVCNSVLQNYSDENKHRDQNRQLIMQYHCYSHRIEELIRLVS